MALMLFRSRGRHERPRWADPKPVTVEESLLLPATAEQVWALVSPAEAAATLSPEIRHAFALPGTGPGLGEKQCGITRDRVRFVEEVVGWDPPRQAVTRTLEPAAIAGSTSTYTLDAADGGCVLTIKLRFVAGAGISNDPDPLREHLRSVLQRAREALTATG